LSRFPFLFFALDDLEMQRNSPPMEIIWQFYVQIYPSLSLADLGSRRLNRWSG